jgi:hypothetical protein
MSGQPVHQIPAAIREPDTSPATASAKKDTRWKPGQSGNHKGRPKGSRNKLGAEKHQTQALLKTIMLEKVPGANMVLVEAFLRSLAVRALKDISAARLLTRLMKEYKVLEALSEKTFSPVLIVPGMMDDAEWEKRAFAEQAQYRGNRGGAT